MFTRTARSAIRSTKPLRQFSSGAGSSGSGPALPLAALALAIAGYANYENSNLDSQVCSLTDRVTSLTAEKNGLQVQLSGKTNSAFVFIKPHACKGTPGKVEEAVEDHLKKAGIRITGKGEMLAETIDEKQHIDTHYGAIASKAVKLEPKELNVPDKGKAAFEKMFGEKWDDAVAAGKVYNAKDGAAKLGLDGAGVNAKWSKLKKDVNLIKFGGGFYCGKVDGIYIMNGFYMSMRAAYCNPGEKIMWYTVNWPSDSLSWEDFRGVVLGATDPTTAPKGSVRRYILDNYKQLGLQTKPNTGDNGVHASASPFEAMAERVNWLGADFVSDDFGKGMIAANVSKDVIEKWSGDCQVSVQGETDEGKTMSVFDTLEDLDADTILGKLKKIQ